MTSFNLDIVTPIRELKIGEVNYLRCPGIDGSFGLMNNHREGILALAVGEVKVTQGGKDEYFSTGGGFVEIIDNSVKLLVESIERSNDIDTDRAQRSFDRAKKRQIDKDPDTNNARIDASMMRALNRLRVAKR